jgi:periplasmic protein TonB
MNHGPPKPCVRRPPAPTSPGGIVALPPVVQAKARSSKAGLWLSIGIHAALIAAAGTITFHDSGGNTDGAGGPATEDEHFEMAVNTSRIQKAEQESLTPPKPRSAPPAPAQKWIVAMTNSPSLLEWPAIEPIATTKTAQPALPAAAAAPAENSAGQQTKKSTARDTKVGGRKGKSEKKASSHSPPRTPPKLISGAPPRYPSGAKRSKESGKVGVLVQVQANGSAAATRIYRSSGNAQLDQAAVTAARSWKFTKTPSMNPDETIAVVVQVTFKL